MSKQELQEFGRKYKWARDYIIDNFIGRENFEENIIDDIEYNRLMMFLIEVLDIALVYQSQPLFEENSLIESLDGIMDWENYGEEEKESVFNLIDEVDNYFEIEYENGSGRDMVDLDDIEDVWKDKKLEVNWK